MGTSAAAAIVAKERHIVEAFRRAGATAMHRAVTPEAVRISEGLAFHKLCKHAILREAGPGTFYLDEAAWAEWRSVRRRTAMVLLAVALGTMLVVWLRTR